MLTTEVISLAGKYGQKHLIDAAERLRGERRLSLESQIAALDFAGLQKLYQFSMMNQVMADLSKCVSPPIIRLGDMQQSSQAQQAGEDALRAGRISVILVAGGQGTRLGHDAPKGTFPIGPVTQRSLFQIHAEKVLALSRRFGKPVPLLIMTSDENDQATKSFFEQHQYFGLNPHDVAFFIQGMLPALDAQTGQVLLKTPSEIALSPNGHGGVIEALQMAGHLDRLAEQGITDCFYFQVDNPLVKVADPIFLGHHLIASAEMSLKVLAKLYATERMGNLVQMENRCRIIEYTELPSDIAEQREPDGKLRIWAGSPAIHIFNLNYLQRLGRGEINLPYHVARKAVPFVNEAGQMIKPSQPNALKFERFVFDALPFAERVVAMETSREDEFEPVKNATGENSPESARRAMSQQYASWLKAAGIEIDDSQYIEISPLDAMDAGDVCTRTKWLSTGN